MKRETKKKKSTYILTYRYTYIQQTGRKQVGETRMCMYGIARMEVREKEKKNDKKPTRQGVLLEKEDNGEGRKNKATDFFFPLSLLIAP